MKKKINKKDIKFKKTMIIKIRNCHSKQFCNDIRSPEKMSNCYSIITNCYGVKDLKLLISSIQKKTLKKYFTKKNRQWKNLEIYNYLKNEIVD